MSSVVAPKLSAIGPYKQVDFSNVPYAVDVDLTNGVDGPRGTDNLLGSQPWQILPNNLAGYLFVIGSAYDDYLCASSAGNSRLQGGAGNDTLVFAGQYDYLWGGSGTNTADFQLFDKAGLGQSRHYHR